MQILPGEFFPPIISKQFDGKRVFLVILILAIVGSSCVSAAAIPGVIGFRWNTSDSSPRLYQIDSDGTVIPNASGDWFNTHLPWSGMKTVVVNASNATPVLYGTNNRGDGLDFSGTYGDVMVEIPRFYTCSTYANGNFSYWISPDPQDALQYTVHPMFNQRGTGTAVGTAAPYYYVGRYDANDGGSSKLQSATGKSPLASQTIGTFRTYAENKGAGWGITNIWTVSALRQLFYTEMVTLNSQTAWTGSRGVVDFPAAGSALNSGADSIDAAVYTMNATGNGTGLYGKTPISYRGIENLWGNIWQFQDGFNALKTPGTTNVINATGLGLTGQKTIFKDLLDANDVQSVGALVPITDTVNGEYQTNLLNTSIARPLFLPSETGGAGSETTYLSDKYWAPKSTTAAIPNILFSGGAWYDAGGAGVGSLVVDNVASFSHAALGARLEFRFPAPVASFSSTNISIATNTTSQGWAGIAPFTMVFNDTSTNTPTSWRWGRNNLTSPAWEQFSTTNNATQAFVAGNWSVNVTATNSVGSSISGSTWVNVSQAAPTITGITPGSGQNTTTISITNLAGTGFYGTPTVNLTRAGYGNITATGVTLVSANQITCTFDLTNRISGTWKVNVTNPDGQQAAFLDGFTITNSSIPTPAPAPTQAPAGSGDVGPVQQQSTSSSSGMSIVNGAPAGQTVTYSFGGPATDYPISIESISFVPGQPIGQSQCIITRVSPTAGLTIPDRPGVYESIQINWINPSVISGATIQFSVKGSWLREQNIGPQDVVMMRQHDLIWTEIPTVFDHVANDIYYFRSMPPGFSNFAVSVRKNVTTVVVPGVTAMPAPSLTMTSTPATTMITSSTISSTAVRVTSPTSTPVPEPAGGNKPGVAIPVPVLVVAAIILLATGGFLVRRWWIHRQNPALFRKYD